MKFRLNHEDFLRGLNIVTRVLSARTTQQILEGVRISTMDEGLSLTCSDGNMSINTYVPALIEETGDAVLPGKLLLDVVRRMPESEIRVTVNRQYVLTMRSGDVRMTLSGQDGSLYPSLPIVSAENQVAISQNALLSMIQQTSFAIAVESPHKVLTGALLEISEDEMTMVGLDGYRLAMSRKKIPVDCEPLKAIIPLKAVQEIGRILDDGAESEAVLQIGGSQMMMRIGKTTIYSLLIEGEYTDYRRILPGSWKTQIAVDTQAMMECVDRASLIAREGKNNLIRMHVFEEGMEITSNSENGEVYEKQSVSVEGEEITIAFNVLYVSDVLKAIPSGEFYMRFNSPVSPCVVCPVEEDKGCLYLVLPVRTGA